MDNDIRLKHHLLTQFLLNPRWCFYLGEERHHLTEIDALTSYFSNLVSQQIRTTFQNKRETEKIYTEKIPIKTFFSDFTLQFKIVYSDDEKQHGCGGLFKYSSIFKDSNGKWCCKPYITIHVTTNKWSESYDMFLYILAHELTHGYDLFVTAEETGKSPFEISKEQRYDVINKNIGHVVKNISASAHMLYRLNRMERNAYLGQLRTELRKINVEGKTFQEFYDCVKGTASYEQFKLLEKNIKAALNIEDQGKQQELINALNDIMGKKFTTYNQIKKYYKGRWEKWENAYLIRASKIAYDVYYENGKNSGMDWGVWNSKST